MRNKMQPALPAPRPTHCISIVRLVREVRARTCEAVQLVAGVRVALLNCLRKRGQRGGARRCVQIHVVRQRVTVRDGGGERLGRVAVGTFESEERVELVFADAKGCGNLCHDLQAGGLRFAVAAMSAAKVETGRVARMAPCRMCRQDGITTERHAADRTYVQTCLRRPPQSLLRDMSSAHLGRVLRVHDEVVTRGVLHEG